MDFLEYAQKQYPKTDDVVNILVDSKDTYEKTISLMQAQTTTLTQSIYTMTGIAIQYIDQE